MQDFLFTLSLLFVFFGLPMLLFGFIAGFGPNKLNYPNGRWPFRGQAEEFPNGVPDWEHGQEIACSSFKDFIEGNKKNYKIRYWSKKKLKLVDRKEDL